VPVLAQLPERVIERIGQTCLWREHRAGSQIVGYQELSTDVYFLVAGKVRVIVYSPEGKAVVFEDLASGAMFGEIAAIDRKPRSASVEAREACVVASLTANQFEDLMLQEPPLAIATLRHVVADIRRLSDRVLEFSTLAVQNRIHAELLRLAGHAPQQAGAALLSPAPSLSDIANRISTHREAVSRELSRLSSIGLLQREGRDLRITSVARLSKLVAEAKGE
jgi:CRP-like cAMP-binding protein